MFDLFPLERWHLVPSFESGWGCADFGQYNMVDMVPHLIPTQSQQLPLPACWHSCSWSLRCSVRCPIDLWGDHVERPQNLQEEEKHKRDEGLTRAQPPSSMAQLPAESHQGPQSVPQGRRRITRPADWDYNKMVNILSYQLWVLVS